MNFPESTQKSGVLHSGPRVSVAAPMPPIGGFGAVTVVGEAPAVFLICRTERGRRGWGVHRADGSLLVSGWPSRGRAVAFAERKLSAPAGGSE